MRYLFYLAPCSDGNERKIYCTPKGERALIHSDFRKNGYRGIFWVSRPLSQVELLGRNRGDPVADYDKWIVQEWRVARASLLVPEKKRVLIVQAMFRDGWEIVKQELGAERSQVVAERVV